MSSNTVFLRCPPELTLNKSYNDPDNMQALCGDMPPSDGMPSNSTYLICPQELTLNKSYNDPDNMEILCGDMPPSSNGSTQGGSAQGDSTQGGSTQGSLPQQPYNICPNGETAIGNSDGETNTCQPIKCPSGYTLGYDSQGIIGCKDSVDNLYICGSGESLQISPVDGSAYCGITPGANDTFRNGGMTINYGVCPTTNYAKNSKNACQYGEGPAGQGNTGGPAGQGNTEEPSLFTNVNGFRSKKERKVENFSQKINNSKCKTRY